MYRVLGLDLDGTLTNGKKEITPRTRRALEACAQRGIAIALASGRPLIGMKPVGEALELSRWGGYLVAYNGAQVYDCRTGELILRHAIPRAIAPLVCQVSRRYGVSPVTYDAEGIVSEDKTARYVLRECYNNRLPVKQVPDVAAFLTEDVPKLMLAGEHDALEQTRQALAPEMAGVADLYFSEFCFLEVMPVGVEKATGLSALLDRLGASPSQLMTFGDGINDIPMLRFAGMGVAMGNAYPEVLESADYVTGTNEEDGVAQALEKFILTEE